MAAAHPICLAPALAATAPVLTGDTQTRTAGHNSVLQQQGSEEQSNMFVDNCCCKCLDTSEMFGYMWYLVLVAEDTLNVNVCRCDKYVDLCTTSTLPSTDCSVS